MDKGSANGAGLEEGPGVGTDDGAGLTEVLLELEAPQSEVLVLLIISSESNHIRPFLISPSLPRSQKTCSALRICFS